MVKDIEQGRRKREQIQIRFWNEVGAIEHVNLPKLEAAIRKEFNCEDDRFVDEQVRLMQTEGRIRIQNKSKVWIKRPNQV